MTDQPPTARHRWLKRTLVTGAFAVPMLALAGGSASAAELTPIAEYLDSTVASTSASLVSALATLLGVS
ncbi:hypothetical protein [Amycolatopsis jiangsuensis]|uniref:Secreted protein n=1 Tax=Amycolatopsis jiangsuensis TaxID=1181879 RepID=A0A840IJT6_9PSEU|nr:hypothetical protein [Amycolatopsis jiangsuensis]MBB4682526.1 hypothetical protein [Amycolatopsis jiangsuensis]